MSTLSPSGVSTAGPTSIGTALTRLLLAHPYQQFRRDPRFYLRYDGTYLALFAGLCILLWATRCPSALATVHWTPWHFILGFPLTVYVLIGSHLLIHNATHGSLPRRINRLVGELLGVLVFVRYASWAIVHMRHHQHSDDTVRDPHPNHTSFVRSFVSSVVTVERQLQDGYCEIWGDTVANRRAEVTRARVSYGTNVVLAIAWYLVLGPFGFFAFWLPGNLLAALFVGHFNWATHNGSVGRDFRPVNLDHGYYWSGNRIFAGIYHHANHHARPHLRNPRLWDTARFGPAEPPVDAPSAVARWQRSTPSGPEAHGDPGSLR